MEEKDEILKEETPVEEPVVSEPEISEAAPDGEAVAEPPKKKKEMKIDIKGILKVVGLLYFILILVGVLTYVIKPGMYTGDPAEFHFITDPAEMTRIPWYRWFTSPVETLIFDPNKITMYEIAAMILILGGCFKVMEECGAMNALIQVLIAKFKKRRFLAIAAISVVIMVLCSLFGIQDELLILFPICLSFAAAMGWDKKTALSLVLITSGVGFTCALLNPLTVGICSTLTGTSVLDGLWYRAIMLVLLGVATCFFMIWMARRDEKRLGADFERLDHVETLDPETKKKAWLITALFMFVFVMIVLFAAIPVLRDLGLGLVVVAVAFVIGTVVIGRILIGSWKKWFLAFWHGLKAIAPSIFVIVTAFAIKYIAEQGQILHTIFYYMYDLFSSISPYAGVLLLLAFILLLEFFIPSASAKAALIIPLLTVTPIPGISTNVIILAYLLGDGYTNVVYPTCGTLMIGLGLADVSYIDWIKRTGLYQLFLLATSVGFLLLAVAIGL